MVAKRTVDLKIVIQILDGSAKEVKEGEEREEKETQGKRGRHHN